MIENCETKFYFYPLRAITEFFLEGEDEKALSKRLGLNNLLSYKISKEILGRKL